MTGTLALVGAGEFLDTMNHVDQELLAMAGGTRVAILPTASAPDGPGVPERWAKMGTEHFGRLGAQTEQVMALDRASCADPALAARVREANLVYFSGGKPEYLYNTLVDTLVWQAVMDVLTRGGVIAGCSAGAMIMGANVPVFTMRLGIPTISQWQKSFGLVPHAIIAPHYNEFPEVFSNLIFGGRPQGTFLIGVDAETALVGSEGNWKAMGARRVTIKRDHTTQRYIEGQKVMFE
jgi:cyanophycinase